MDTKIKNSFFPGLIYWNNNRIHLNTFKKYIFVPMVPPLPTYLRTPLENTLKEQSQRLVTFDRSDEKTLPDQKKI